MIFIVLLSKTIGGATLHRPTADPRAPQKWFGPPWAPKIAPKIASRGSKTASGDPKFAPRRARSLQDRPKRLRSENSDPSSDQKCVVLPTFSNTFSIFVFSPQERVRGHLGAQFGPTWVVESGQERPKSGPRAAQEQPKSGPRATKSDPRAANRGPEPRRWAQERPRRAQDGLGASQRAPQGLPDPPPSPPGPPPNPSRMRKPLVGNSAFEAVSETTRREHHSSSAKALFSKQCGLTQRRTQ